MNKHNGTLSADSSLSIMQSLSNSHVVLAPSGIINFLSPLTDDQTQEHVFLGMHSTLQHTKCPGMFQVNSAKVI